jgi:hypothetical protein
MARKKTQKRAYKQVKNRKRRFFLPWPLFIFLMLCAGVFLVASTFNVGADDIFVTAKIHGPAVTSPAIITSPANGSYFTSVPVLVKGQCPQNAVYVVIYRNNLMDGAAICDSQRNFQIFVDLFNGQNSLVAHSFNVTDDEGPVSATTTVYYNPSTPGPNQSGNVAPLALTTNFVYKGYYVGQELSWPVSISGGLAPYAVSIDWGDTNRDLISRSAPGDFNITHTYTSHGNYKNSYEIKITASDNDAQKAYLQFFVIVNTPAGAVPTAGNIFNKPSPGLGNKNWLFFVWPAYSLILILTLSFWLGEHEELIILRRHGRLRHR